LLEKQEANLLEIKEDLPFESRSAKLSILEAMQFGSDRPALPSVTSSNLSEAIGIFHELIEKRLLA
jgi:hypothetical protein